MTPTCRAGPRPGSAGQRHRGWARIRQQKWANIRCHGQEASNPGNSFIIALLRASI
jgi:hypothetical protein